MSRLSKLGVGPHELRVGPHTYTVMFVPSVDEAVHAAERKQGDIERDDKFGHINHKTGELFVGLDMRGTQQADTLLHEALHAVLAQIGRDEEVLVHGLAPGLLDLLRDNPWFVRFMQEARQ